MQDSYPIPQYVLDAYSKCKINWTAKQIRFPRRQFADISNNDSRIQAWFDLITRETGLDLTPNNIFQICIKNHLTTYTPAKCPTCGKLLSVNSVKIGVQYCSNKCAQSDPKIIAKVQTTLKKNFGEEGHASKAIQEKTRATVKAKYGVDSVAHVESFREKAKQTNLARYGAENPYASEQIKEKIRSTWLKNYGKDNPNKASIIKDKKISTCIDKFGGNSPLSSSAVKSKFKQTCLDKYGVDHPNKSQEIRDKIIRTNLERYGEKTPLQSAAVMQKYISTNQARYNADSPLESFCIRSKIIASRRNNYYPKFLQLLAKKNIEYLSDKDAYISKGLLQFRCTICKTEWSKDESIQGVNVIRCPKCSSEHFVSKAEKDVLLFVKSLYSGTILENDRTILKPKELDIYIPEKKLAIEFNGIFWHQNKPPKYHFYKTAACRKQGIRLIHVFEHEWYFQREKIENLIKSALGIFDKRIYARRCKVVDITSSQYREFLQEYHLQGSVNSSIRYGLFYKDELVSVIGFGKSRFKKNEIELHRYCVKAGYQIVGGFSKLIKHSGLKEFISYIDLAHFDGKGYKKTGFVKESVTSPAYTYIRGNEVKSRVACQKHKLAKFLEAYDENLSESDNMKANGWIKVYDCGNLKVVYKSS